MFKKVKGIFIINWLVDVWLEDSKKKTYWIGKLRLIIKTVCDCTVGIVSVLIGNDKIWNYSKDEICHQIC